MAKKQTRRSVSIRGTTYERIREHCEVEGISMSEFVESRISMFFDGSAPEPAKRKPLPKPPVPTPRKATAPRPAPAPEPIAKAAPAPKVAKKPSAGNGSGNGNGNGEDEALTFDELQDAARFFTF